MRRRRHAAQHDGYPVAYVPRRWYPRPAAIDLHSRHPVAVLPARYSLDEQTLRRLGHNLTADAELVIVGVRIVAVACSCGWRSELRVLSTPGRWARSALRLSTQAHAELKRRWLEHADAR